jgi:hypothetical protein
VEEAMPAERPAGEPLLPANALPQVGQAGRYVVLRHQVPAASADPASGTFAALGRGDHYDWMFEVDGHLLTWASDQWCDVTQAAVMAALPLPPHRLAYLDYEGEISGNRGTVRRVEAGTHRLLDVALDRYTFAVQGDRTGNVTFYRTAPSGSWAIALAP